RPDPRAERGSDRTVGSAAASRRRERGPDRSRGPRRLAPITPPSDLRAGLYGLRPPLRPAIPALRRNIPVASPGGAVPLRAVAAAGAKLAGRRSRPGRNPRAARTCLLVPERRCLAVRCRIDHADPLRRRRGGAGGGRA